jgi:transcriptional regulator with XRE-family HTH domain
MAILDSAVMKAARKARGLTQERVAELLGHDQPTIQRWERGTRTPGTLDDLVALCDVLGVSADALLGRQPVPSLAWFERTIEKAFTKGGNPKDLAEHLRSELLKLAGMVER